MITTVYFKNKAQLKTLVKLAKDLDILVTRGPGAGETGSVSRLMQDIADGKIKLEQAEPNLKSP